MEKNTFSLTEKQAKFLKEQAEKKEISTAEILRRILDNEIERGNDR